MNSHDMPLVMCVHVLVQIGRFIVFQSIQRIQMADNMVNDNKICLKKKIIIL